MTEVNWVKISDRLPPVGRFVIVACPSDYTTTPMDYCTASRHEYSNGGSWVWLTVSNDYLSEGHVNAPEYWCDLLCPPT